MKTLLFALLAFDVLAISARGADIDLLCPKQDETHRYVMAQLMENQPSEAGVVVREWIRIYYELLQPFDPAKKTFLVLNGGPGGDHGIIETFRNNDIGKRFNVVGFDHRGIGCTQIVSPVYKLYQEGLYGMSRMSSDLEAIRKDLLGQNGKWFVYGVSFGSMLAQQYGILFPDHVEGLILDSAMHDVSDLNIGRKQFLSTFIRQDSQISRLFDEVTGKYPNLRAEILRKSIMIVYSYSGRTVDLKDYLQKLNGTRTEQDALNILNPMPDLQPPLIGVQRTIFCEELWDYPNRSEEENSFYFWALNLECPVFGSHRRPMHFGEALKKLPIRTFIWGGKFDPSTPIQAMRKMQKLIPNSLLWENPYAGHMLIFEKKDCAIKLAGMFLDGADNKALNGIATSSECQAPPGINRDAEESPSGNTKQSNMI